MNMIVGIKQFVVVIKTGLINTILVKINLFILEDSCLSYLLFDFSPVKMQEKKILWRENTKLFVSCFSIIFFLKNSMEEGNAPSLL